MESSVYRYFAELQSNIACLQVFIWRDDEGAINPAEHICKLNHTSICQFSINVMMVI